MRERKHRWHSHGRTGTRRWFLRCWRLLHLLAPRAPTDPPGLVERQPQELAALLGVAPSTVSEHLSKLAELSLVVARQQGHTRFYRLTNSPFLLSLLSHIEELCVAVRRLPGV